MPQNLLKTRTPSAKSSAGQSGDRWSAPMRTFVSLLLIIYLCILLLGPLSNPSGSAHLTEPLARLVAPVHRALFLGHGYRFFAPEPGPSHSIECRMEMNNGDPIVTHFPDRQRHVPRLMYHRWFMLAETIFTELNGTPDEGSFAESKKQLQQEIDRLAQAGKVTEKKTLARQRDQLLSEYAKTRSRIDALIRSVARALIEEYPDATSIDLRLRERAIPFPQDVTDGMRLDDPQFLAKPVSIGKFSRDELLAADPQTNRELLPELP